MCIYLLQSEELLVIEFIIREVFFFFIGEVIDLFFDLINKYFVCSGDKYVFVFNNIIGYRVFIDDFQEKFKFGNI